MNFFQEWWWYVKAANKQTFDFTSNQEGFLSLGGRSSRKEYWYNWFFFSIIMFVATFMKNLFFTIVEVPYAIEEAGGLPVKIFGLYSTLFLIRLQIRRLHDANKSGFIWLFLKIGFSILSFVAVVLYTVYLYATDAPMGAELFLYFGFAIIIFAAVYGIQEIILFVFYCLPSTDGPTKYGKYATLNPYREEEVVENEEAVEEASPMEENQNDPENASNESQIISNSEESNMSESVNPDIHETGSDSING